MFGRRKSGLFPLVALLATILALLAFSVNGQNDPQTNDQQDDGDAGANGAAADGNDDDDAKGDDNNDNDGNDQQGDQTDNNGTDGDDDDQQEKGGDDDTEDDTDDNDNDTKGDNKGGNGNGDDDDNGNDGDDDDGGNTKKGNTKGNSKGNKNNNKNGDDDDDDNADDDDDDDGGNGNGGKKRGRTNGNADDDDDDDDADGASGGGRGNKRARGNVVETLRCQDKKGNFLPIATVCKDEMSKSFCKKVFPKNSRNPNGRPLNCDLHGLEEVAYKCAHHCKICCELSAHGCGDDPTYHINCENRKNLCHNMTEMMTSACAATCGFCNKGPCADKINGCIGLRSMCRHHKEFGGDLMKCSRTCGFCTAKCVDLSTDCALAERTSCYRPPDDHPEENPYYEAMSKVCRKTCDLCSEPMPIDPDSPLDFPSSEQSDNENDKDDDKDEDDEDDDDDNDNDNDDNDDDVQDNGTSDY